MEVDDLAGKYWRSSPLVFSLEPRCQGLLGSQKYTCTPLSTVNWAWRAISTPWSHVSERRSWHRQRLDLAGQRRGDRS
jgi:hypothetical protein